MPEAPKRIPTLRELKTARDGLVRAAKTGVMHSEMALRQNEPHDLRHQIDVLRAQLNALYEILATGQVFTEHEYLTLEVAELAEIVNDYQAELGTGVTLA
jgi:hypothetical protein